MKSSNFRSLRRRILLLYSPAIRSEGEKDQDYEAVIEVNHKFVLTRGIAITPDIQYVIRPAGTGDIDDALLLGGRLSVQF